MNSEEDEFNRIEREASLRKAAVKSAVGKHTIDMAREAGMVYREFEDEFANANTDGVDLKTLKAFEALIRADEREACAKVCDRVVEGKDPDDIHSDSQWAALTLAAEIRARSNT